MSCNCENRFDEVWENNSIDTDCGCNQERDHGCDNGGRDDRCGCSRKEYLGKSITETKYFRVKTKRFIPHEKPGCGCGCGCR